MPRAHEVDETTVTEVKLFLENDEYLWNRRRPEFVKNLAKKLADGKYDHRQSVGLWQYLADEAAQQYDAQFGSGGKGSKAWMEPQDRKALAQELADDFKAEVEDGEHEDVIKQVMSKKRRKELGLE